MRVQKRHVARGGKNIIFRRGRGIYIVFGPKYRPLASCKAGRRTFSEHETGPEELCEIKWDYHICQHDSLVTIQYKACLRRDHNDQSRRGHQCSETMLTGEYRFHASIPWGLNLGECSEVAGSPQYSCTIFVAMSRYFLIFAFAHMLENLALL